MELVTRKAVITDIQRVSKRVKTLTRENYRTLGNYASSTVEEKFGTFSKALRAAKVANVAAR
jgi:hypothetical protein